ncbi:acetyl esterase/lipase [Filimonas zeae]|uniref:BD-FAE-like domain-containing protein n=1 Tax=Filimonas zeae TaxID=1737353 RepID=A0A917IR58_9BACT|nr:alpha/beta hydrolase [Filimonas zeae]MDR6337735.1 acetyl esterase/lipase [Filimonas zeae]GGH60012.1 hypothetical protein GCM10011379_07420 [Filimonas zeae]
MLKISLAVWTFLLAGNFCLGQEVIQLRTTGSVASGTSSERSIPVDATDTIVYNVSSPSITVYRPDSSASNGAAVVVCPGGAFHLLAMNNEGINVAKWLTAKGYTVFVLKYRLLPIESAQPMQVIFERAKDFKKLVEIMAKDVPLAIADGKAAVEYVRAHAAAYKLDTAKIGIMGFSAGGTVAAGVALAADKASHVNFTAPIYPYLYPFDKVKVPANAPPLFIAVTSDDDFGFNAGSVDLYKRWQEAGGLSELHIYAKGRHGFGMKKQQLPVDHWMEACYEWLKYLGMN